MEARFPAPFDFLMLRSIALKTAATIFFAIKALLIKLVGDRAPVAELALFRSFISMACCSSGSPRAGRSRASDYVAMVWAIGFGAAILGEWPSRRALLGAFVI